MSDSLIIRNLQKSYNGIQIFENVNFNLNGGTIVNLTGPNGSGKTTLMKILCSQILDYDGEVLIGKDNILDLGKELFTKICYSSPYTNLYEYLTLEENIDFFLNLNDIKENKKKELISNFELEDYKSKKVNQLSDGTKKKISILIIFLINPSFFILDEPFTYLDDKSSKVLIELIKLQISKGNSFLIADNSSAINNLDFNQVVTL